MKLRAMQYLREPTPQRLQAAKEKLETAVKLGPTAVDAQLLLIGIALEQGEYESARDYVIRAIGSNPDNPALLLARSRVELALKNTQMGIQLAQMALQEEPNNVAAMVMLARAYRLSGDMDRSKQWIEQVESLDPNNLAVFEARCLWLGSQRKFVELAEICSTFLSTKEQDLNKVLMVASILSNADSKEFKREAVKGFEYVMTLSPTMLPVKLGLASTLYKVQDIERAKTLYQELLEQYPDNIQVLNDLAWILQEHEHRYEPALELVNKGLSLVPHDLHLLDTRGTILAKMADRLVDARTDFETLEQLSPSDSPRQARTLLKLGRICAQLNDHDKARQHFKKASEIDQKIGVFTPEERSEISGVVQRYGM
jgi:tetratricopeptide (TPR) repeat protein